MKLQDHTKLVTNQLLAEDFFIQKNDPKKNLAVQREFKS
jgi:hypothetical protein